MPCSQGCSNAAECVRADSHCRKGIAKASFLSAHGREWSSGDFFWVGWGMHYVQSTHLFLDAKKGLNENPQKLHRCFSQLIHFLVRIQNSRDLYWNMVKNFLVLVQTFKLQKTDGNETGKPSYQYILFDGFNPSEKYSSNCIISKKVGLKIKNLWNYHLVCILSILMFCLHSCSIIILISLDQNLRTFAIPNRFQEMPSMWLVCTANAHGMWDIPAWAQRAPHWSRRLPASRRKWWISTELLLHFWVDMEAILYLSRIPWFHSGFGWVFVKLLKPSWFPPSTLLSLKRALEFPRKHLGVSICFFFHKEE